MLQEYGGHISRSSERVMRLPDGSYYFVEVTSKEGTKYIIEAYGEEALELARETGAKRKKYEQEELVITA